MTVYAITDTKKGRTEIAPPYLQTTLLSQSTVSEINSISRNATATVLVMCNDGDAGQPRGR